MPKVEEIVENFPIKEEMRVPVIDEALKSHYGSRVKEILLNPIGELINRNCTRANYQTYSEMYVKLSEVKFDLSP